jgi:hypothetical protein
MFLPEYLRPLIRIGEADVEARRSWVIPSEELMITKQTLACARI